MLPGGLPAWTVDSWRTGVRKDPINVVFHGALGTLGACWQALRDVGFEPARTGADQWFAVRTSGSFDLHRNDESLDDVGTLVRWERTHTRLYHPGEPDPGLGPVTGAPIHHDRPTPLHWALGCGEVATSFNGPREHLADLLSGQGRTVARIRTRDRRSVRQCDGSRVIPDGQVILVG